MYTLGGGIDNWVIASAGGGNAQSLTETEAGFVLTATNKRGAENAWITALYEGSKIDISNFSTLKFYVESITTSGFANSMARTVFFASTDYPTSINSWTPANGASWTFGSEKFPAEISIDISSLSGEFYIGAWAATNYLDQNCSRIVTISDIRMV